MVHLKAILHPKKVKKEKTIYRLALRVTNFRKRSYFHLGYNIDPNDWDEKAEKVKKSHPKYQHLNRLIRKKYDQLDDIIYEAERNKTQLSAKQITDKIRDNTRNKSFFDFAKEHVEDLEKSKKFNRAISDRSKAKNIKEFTKGKDVLFQEIDENFLRRFKIYLKNEKNNSERSVMNSYVFIRLLFNRAIKNGIIDQSFYPFGRGKILIKYPESLKIGLTEEEILKIEQLDLQTHTPLWHTRNIFLFSFYLAGIRITDVLHLKWNDIIEDRLLYRMKKNAKLDSLKLPEKVIVILKFYREDQRSYADFIFPELKKVGDDETKQKYSIIKGAIKKHNSNLQNIAKLAEIDKKITNHIARHSFGNIAGDKVSPQMLQKLYRHSSLSTTIGYQGNFIHASSDQALNEILKFSTEKKN
ncbi:site-specific integrase [Salegentibacter sp. F188]|uniref:Site-specific integrase n=1 Tax=Autumnicola patrickiae TaxID=3075591 RepID=A0ABU3E226_9FLAO|nr:site-specific integrase [Salegentibacter sp. F188]MDT0690053.1 site-specific integrase [Salegentibacter sp. F188]